MVGTLAYMAPEQAEGEPAGEPADTYSLALTLYELWAGTNPVARATPAHTAREIGQPLPSLREYRPDLPAARSPPASTPACARSRSCAPRSPSSTAVWRPRFRRLTAERPVPPPRADERREHGAGWLRAAQLVALTAWGLAVTLVAARSRAARDSP